MDILTTNRLMLKSIKAEDREQFYKLFSDRKLLKYTDNEPHKTIKDTQLLIKKYHEEEKEGQSIRKAIYLEKKYIGIISIYHINKKHKFATIGYLISEEYQNKGIMTEACFAIIKYIFNNLPINRIEAQVFVKNIASIKILEKLGFQKEGRLRQNFMINNKLEDSFMYSILKIEWMD